MAFHICAALLKYRKHRHQEVLIILSLVSKVLGDMTTQKGITAFLKLFFNKELFLKVSDFKYQIYFSHLACCMSGRILSPRGTKVRTKSLDCRLH